MVIRLNKLGKKKIGNKFYQVYKTTPRNRSEAIGILKSDWSIVKPQPTKNGEVIILVRGSKL